jgi:hypothetical protein
MSNETAAVVPIISHNKLFLRALDNQLKSLRSLRDDLTTTLKIAKRRAGTEQHAFEDAISALEVSLEKLLLVQEELESFGGLP